MLVAGEKTQLLVLSQNAKDAVGCTIKVSGKTVRAGDSLVLLGIEFDRRLQFGAHCRRLRRRVRPRVAHLRRLAGRSWGLDEQALRTVANGYVRGALEHAAAAWLPATAPSHAELIEREMRAAARIVTGCPRSTPTHAVMAEARLAPMEERKKVLAARLLGRALALPPTDPLRRTAEASAPPRLSSVRGWRTLGRQMLAEVEVTAPIEPVLPPRIPPWERGGNVTFCLDVGPLRTGATEGEKIRAATRHLAALPQRATWLWTDGSVEGGVKDGGSGAVVIWSDGEEEDLKTPAGRHCSSYRAEMLALASGLEHLLDNPRDRDIPIVICTDSMASLATLRAGPTAQTSPLGVRIWRAFSRLSREGHRPIHAQWVPSHCGIEGNERADTIAKEAAELPQEDIPVDSRTICRARRRRAAASSDDDRLAAFARDLSDSWYSDLPPKLDAGGVSTSNANKKSTFIRLFSHHVSAIDCFKCVSNDYDNPMCEDPFHNNFTSEIYESPCMGGRKDRNGLFPATACIKLNGVFPDTGKRLMVRGCALDSGTLTTDTEIIRMSHCGGLEFQGRYLKGCLQSCDDIDGCNGAGVSALTATVLLWSTLVAAVVR
ncbi:Retrovirus-related Pol polyprotein from type-1 retrotransposable element R1 4 [Amphibalanus amphitrite]|uniref:Retrovirus-related Pol polyprotein from type-1 retrotransposable element R1 4 n=1 Tax=Amphibalanus amphitrite TaxID=1232801 RepID=A0A6A4WSS5_AMPAM|nr:Retrovirus-related Pol polyprotein from type-1 retrotransposable element R1 4 [Amphibalanus amphitrite]